MGARKISEFPDSVQSLYSDVTRSQNLRFVACGFGHDVSVCGPCGTGIFFHKLEKNLWCTGWVPQWFSFKSCELDLELSIGHDELIDRARHRLTILFPTPWN